AFWSIFGNVGALTVKGLVDDWDLNVQGTLGKTVLGQVSESDLTVTDKVFSMAVQTFLNSNLYAGFVPINPADPRDGGPFRSVVSRGSFTAGGVKGSSQPAFANSNVVAPTVGKVTLKSVKRDNGGRAYGVVADVSIAGVTVTTPAFRYDKTRPTPQE